MVGIILLMVMYQRPETFRSCRDCDFLSMSSRGTLVLNPYFYPSSATSCVDDLYIGHKDTGTEVGMIDPPPISPSTPDHVLLTN